jgi:hypothetical protein
LTSRSTYAARPAAPINTAACSRATSPGRRCRHGPKEAKRCQISKGGRREITRNLHPLPATVALLAALFAAEPAWAQKQGGVLKLYTLDSPASMSIHEETTVFAQRAMIAVFNNLVMFDQHVKQNSLQSTKRSPACAMRLPAGSAQWCFAPTALPDWPKRWRGRAGMGLLSPR